MNEEDLEQLADDWKRMRDEISSLKADVRELLSLIRLLSVFEHRQTSGTAQDEASQQFDKRLQAILEKHGISTDETVQPIGHGTRRIIS